MKNNIYAQNEAYVYKKILFDAAGVNILKSVTGDLKYVLIRRLSSLNQLQTNLN